MTTYTPEQYPEESHGYGGAWLIRLTVLVFSGVIFLLLLLTIFVSVFQLQYRGRVMPNISAYGVDIGGMTPDAARQALEGQFAAENNRVFTFRDGDLFWQSSAAELGVSFDAEATVQEAMTHAHSGNPVLDLVDQALIWLNGEAVSPIITYDQNAALARLNGIAEEINRLPSDASLTINGTNVEITPASFGRTVDVMATLGRLDSAILERTSGGEIPLAINETPPTVANVEEAAARARTALSGAVMLVADDGNGNALGPWIASVEQIAALLRVATTRDESGAIRYEIDVNTGAFQAYLENLGRGLIVPTENGRFHFNDNTRQLERIRAARNGRTLNVAQTLSNMEAAIFNPNNRTVAMAFDYQLPPYHDNITAAELGIRELVSSGVSYYAGSTRARIDNIITSAARFDGLIIAPGEIFSFNRFVGDISPEEGYVSSGVIFGGRTIQGVGGGVCQVSTTAYRAAFYAGFPIVERYAHGYRVGYYEHGDVEGVGMDAAIFTPDLDFRFLNDTDYHLLIETSVYPANNSIEFRFYSTNPGRQVIKQGPVVRDQIAPLATIYEANPDLTLGQELQVDWAAEGAYVEVTRRILDANGNELDREIFASQYQPWGAIVQVASGDSRATN